MTHPFFVATKDLVSHGLFAYSDVTGKSKAIYAHEVSFEQLSQITKVDSVGAVPNVAMRDADYTFSSSLGTGIMTTDIDLDDEPIV